MEKLPKNFPRKVLKNKFRISKEWENSSRIVHPETFYRLFQEILRGYGIDLTKNVKVLEIGSGNAVFLNYLRKRGVNAVGVDTRSRGDKKSLQVFARIEQLPFAEESFDVVLSNAVFDKSIYTQYQDLMIGEIARVLKHEGIYLGNRENIRIDALSPIDGFSLISNNSVTVYRKS